MRPTPGIGSDWRCLRHLLDNRSDRQDVPAQVYLIDYTEANHDYTDIPIDERYPADMEFNGNVKWHLHVQKVAIYLTSANHADDTIFIPLLRGNAEERNNQALALVSLLSWLVRVKGQILAQDTKAIALWHVERKWITACDYISQIRLTTLIDASQVDPHMRIRRLANCSPLGIEDPVKD